MESYGGGVGQVNENSGVPPVADGRAEFSLLTNSGLRSAAWWVCGVGGWV
jgi:hypothetical protein